MKRIALTFIAVIVLTLSITVPAFASGDKVRGEKGEGDVRQFQVMDPPPFQP